MPILSRFHAMPLRSMLDGGKDFTRLYLDVYGSKARNSYDAFSMGATTSAPIKQQVKALKGRRYKRGMRPDKYFDIVVKRELGELLEILTFSNDEAFELFVQVQRCRTKSGILLLSGRGIAVGLGSFARTPLCSSCQMSFMIQRFS